MTEEQKQYVIQYLMTHPRRACASCNNNTFGVLEIVTTHAFMPGGNPDVRTVVPIVLLTCQQCFALVPYSAVLMGVPGLFTSAIGAPMKY